MKRLFVFAPRCRVDFATSSGASLQPFARMLIVQVISATIILATGTSSIPGYPGKNGELLYLVRSQITCDDGSVAVRSPHGNKKKEANLTIGTDLRIGAAPVWSPDGSMIAFTGFPCSQPNSNTHLYLMNANGSGIHEIDLEIDISPALNPEFPTWSPDGQVIAFVGDTFDGQALFSVRPDGIDLQMILPPSELGFTDVYRSLAWSPDGSRLLFSGVSHFPCAPGGCGFSGDVFELYTFTPATGVVERLTDNSVIDQDAVWSPDAQWIAFIRAGRLLVMDLDTRETRDISDPKDEENPSNYQTPAWSPDGSLIAYSHVISEVGIFIFTVKPNGKGARKQITDGPADQWPDWQPIVKHKKNR
jgi:Tol biopolymer transport system component